MQNFNTNQTRHIYVAGAVDSNLDTNLDIALGNITDGVDKKIFFKYVNNDGLLTRSDTIDLSKVKSIKKASTNPSPSGMGSMARPLTAFKLTVDTSKITLASYVGKAINLILTIHGVHDYDMDNSTTFVASVVGTSSNTASAAAFYKAMANAIVKAMPQNDPNYPFLRVVLSKSGTDSEVTFKKSISDTAYIADATSIILIQGPQKYVRGKLSGEPCPFSVATSCDEVNASGVVIGKKDWHTVDSANNVGVEVKAAAILDAATSATLKYVHPLYQIADLEYFALGERGDMYRGFNYPNNYETNYAVPAPTASNADAEYEMLSIEYYWSGDSENVQKSPRLLEIVAPADNVGTSVVNALYTAVVALM